jgi:hypothetical protein
MMRIVGLSNPFPKSHYHHPNLFDRSTARQCGFLSHLKPFGSGRVAEV